VRQSYGSGGPWESRYGYARAVAAGSHLWVSGCTSVVDGEVAHDGDAAAQARAAFAVALRAVDQAGFSPADVVRTRMFVVDLPASGDAVATVHGELFGDVRPASTLLGVAALVDPRLLVEVEVECYREHP
jgi:enamine deaminase RidA (YjgF/YER057c/UK114 family)